MAIGTGKIRILVVEKDSAVRQELLAYLKKGQINVTGRGTPRRDVA